MNIGNHYLKNVKKEFLQYKMLAEKAMAQLEPHQLFFVQKENANSIAAIVKHLHGNMMSRWTSFLTTDGEKPDRKRDEEFDNSFTSRETVVNQWNEGWHCLFTALDALEEDQLENIVYIRNEPHTVMEAINRQLAHYPYHAGQIVFAAKQFKDSEWFSLSVHGERSNEYNADKVNGKQKPIDGLNW